jgi:hypothetical protein
MKGTPKVTAVLTAALRSELAAGHIHIDFVRNI